MMKEIKTPTKIEYALPAQVYMLARWPDATILSGEKAVDPTAFIVAFPKDQSWEWINLVISEAWRPPASATMYFIAKEFYDMDATRIEWNHGAYHVQVSQTSSVFTMKITPLKGISFEGKKTMRSEAARQLSRQIFNSESKMHSYDAHGSPIPVAINGLNEKIAEFSFDPTKMKQLSTDQVVVGEAKSKEDEGISSTPPQDKNSGAAAISVNSPEAWYYWFRNVNWWNDGHAIGFYFLKSNGKGSGTPSFVGNAGVNWFQGPHDRLGRPLPIKSE